MENDSFFDDGAAEAVKLHSPTNCSFWSFLDRDSGLETNVPEVFQLHVAVSSVIVVECSRQAENVEGVEISKDPYLENERKVVRCHVAECMVAA